MSSLDFYNLILTWPKLTVGGHTSICVKYFFQRLMDDYCGCLLFYLLKKRFADPDPVDFGIGFSIP